MASHRRILGLVVALGFHCAAAQAQVFVEAVQYPAWLERGGNAVPMRPGIAIEPKDRIRTGDGARVQLRMSEGSTVKVGERAQVVIERVEDRGLLRAALSVLTGAFRFTTDAARKSAGREVTVRAKNVTIGIRGTDVWGKATDQRDLACLLEGRITVAADGHPQVVLDKPLDFYEKPAGAEPRVASVDAAQVAEWSKETEPEAEGPVARAGGRWTLIAGKFEQREPARELVRTLRSLGYPAELAGGQKGQVFRVQIRALGGEAQARTLMAQLRTVPGMGIPFVTDSDLVLDR